MRLRLVIAAVGIILVSVASATAAESAVCTRPCPYPGDDAGQGSIATWMADGASRAGLPAELPVMAALYESGLRNLPARESDSVGYFQMRTSIWDRGDYAGFPDDPELQFKWFIDQALLVRETMRNGAWNDPGQYGAWIADVERPDDAFRNRYAGRYNGQRSRARALICSTC